LTEALFFPNKDNELIIVDYLNKAKTEIVVCVFAITNNHLADALIAAHKRDVKIRVLTDDEQML